MLLDLAREITELLVRRQVDARVVGGVAVVLHGYVRTTLDIDLYTFQPELVAATLESAGFRFDPAARAWRRADIPVYLVLPEQAGDLRHPHIDIDGVRTVDLADLISMKLRSGTGRMTRAKDLADVVELILRRGLRPTFAGRLARDQQAAFRKLVRTIDKERNEQAP